MTGRCDCGRGRFGDAGWYIAPQTSAWKADCPDLLSPCHGRSVWNRGCEHRMVTGAGASAFLSPFGMTSTRRRENADHADSGSSGHPGAVILSHSIERSLPEVQSELEFPSLLTMGSLVSPKRRESSHQSMLREEVGILASFRDQRIEHEASVQSSRTLPGREARAQGVLASADAS